MPARTYAETGLSDQSEATTNKRHKPSVLVDVPLPRKTPNGLPSPTLSSGQLDGPLDDPPPLNVIIPIGGIGSRFQKEGYRFPKPLINIVGRPMICWLIEKLSLRPQDTLWIAVNQAIDEEFQVGQCLTKWFPKLDARLLRLKYLTKGASETVRPERIPLSKVFPG